MADTENNQALEGSQYALTVRRAANLPADIWTDERIGVIARTVAPPEAGKAEVAMFLAVAAKYDLDPFAKEIWLAKDKGRLIILTGKDSILKVARREPGYLGHESDIVYENDVFELVRSSGTVEINHVISGLGDRGKMIGAYCVARKEGHPPSVVTRSWEDYSHLHRKDNWVNYPQDMMISRVVTAAHRLLYNISGMYTREEVDGGEAEVDLASHQVAKETKTRLQELKERARAQRSPGNGSSGPIVDAEYTVDDGPPTEPADDEDLPEAVKADPQLGKAKGAYFAEWGRANAELQEVHGIEDVDVFRADWQEEHLHERSASAFTTEDFRKGYQMVEQRIGFPEAPAAYSTAEEFDGDMPI